MTSKKNPFCGFPWVVASTGLVGFMICVYFMRGHPKAQPKVVLEKLGIQPATPGLQGIALIHYTTAASLMTLITHTFIHCIRTPIIIFFIHGIRLQ